MGVEVSHPETKEKEVKRKKREERERGRDTCNIIQCRVGGDGGMYTNLG